VILYAVVSRVTTLPFVRPLERAMMQHRPRRSAALRGRLPADDGAASVEVSEQNPSGNFLCGLSIR
jgi:hypothetical protein